jgi:hypothetical protein
MSLIGQVSFLPPNKVRTVTAFEFSTLLIPALGVVVAILVLPRRTQAWILPAVVVVLLVLIALPVKQLKEQRLWFVAGALALAALTLGGWRIAVWLRTRPPRPIFFEVDSISDGAVIADDDVPLMVTGTYSGKATGLRVVLQDTNRQYYLQHPEVELRNGGAWTATNIRPGHNVEKILFVQLGPWAKKHFETMALGQQWGSFGDQLPPNSRLLSAVAITRQVS